MIREDTLRRKSHISMINIRRAESTSTRRLQCHALSVRIISESLNPNGTNYVILHIEISICERSCRYGTSLSHLGVLETHCSTTSNGCRLR